MATAIASAVICAAGNRAEAGEPETPTFLLSAGTDLWRYGAFGYGGLLWSPGGLDKDGFTFKMLLDGGRYSYNSGALSRIVDGTKLSGAAMPGWRFVRGNLTVNVFGGVVVQDYRLTPNDPSSHLHGLYTGGQFATDIWYQPSPRTMATVSGAIASIGPTGYVRAAIGFRVFLPMFIGPETQEIWCGNFQEIEFGAHVTALRFDRFEWSAGSGWALASDGRSSPYLRLGVNARY